MVDPFLHFRIMPAGRDTLAQQHGAKPAAAANLAGRATGDVEKHQQFGSGAALESLRDIIGNRKRRPAHLIAQIRFIGKPAWIGKLIDFNAKLDRRLPDRQVFKALISHPQSPFNNAITEISRATLSNLKSEISNLKSQISNLKSQISNLKFNISCAAAVVKPGSKFGGQELNIPMAISHFTSHISNFKSQISAVTSHISNLKSQISNLKFRLSRPSFQISNLKSQICHFRFHIPFP